MFQRDRERDRYIYIYYIYIKRESPFLSQRETRNAECKINLACHFQSRIETENGIGFRCTDTRIQHTNKKKTGEFCGESSQISKNITQMSTRSSSESFRKPPKILMHQPEDFEPTQTMTILHSRISKCTLIILINMINAMIIQTP